MNNIEILIGLILLFMAVPDLCQRLKRPALVYPVFVLVGFVLGPLANEGVKTMLREAGAVGFLLLLFHVGLEIDLPRPRELVPPLRFAVTWALPQYLLVLVVGTAMGLRFADALVAAAALSGVSVGMAHPAWKHYPGLAEPQRSSLLHILITLEMLAIVALSVLAPTLATGLSWAIPLHLAGIALVVFLVARFAPALTRLFQVVLDKATRWRTHLLVLLVLAVCALGERLGLAAAKTAFFLGLFMSETAHDGKGLETSISPISRQFLIPIFFVSLGLQVEWGFAASLTGLTAFGAAGLLLGTREVVHRRWRNAGGDARAFQLLCPNLTVAALGAAMVLKHGGSPAAANWLLLTGLYLTVAAVILLPPGAPSSKQGATPPAGVLAEPT